MFVVSKNSFICLILIKKGDIRNVTEHKKETLTCKPVLILSTSEL